MNPVSPQGGRADVIVFVGPSMPLELARRTLPDADYRPPIRRGDLESVGPGSLVGIIDGVFAQTLAISPGEIRAALARGVVVYGAASMGALRAAEVPGVVGVGRIFEMYRSGIIERDDEVALQFDPATLKPLTEPLVNVRYAVDRLVRSGTFNRDAGNQIVEASARLHFTERTYPAILGSSKLAGNHDVDDIIRLLRGFDLKREDAQFLLETMVRDVDTVGLVNRSPPADARGDGTTLTTRVNATEPSDAAILIWESGDYLEFRDLVRFLKMTGRFEAIARQALARFAIAGRSLRQVPGFPTPASTEHAGAEAQRLLDATRLVWGWESPEEAHVTMRDLGLGLHDVSASLEAEAITIRVVSAFATGGSRVFSKALRSDLWMDEIALKREALRAGALQFFAELGGGGAPPSEAETAGAKRTICRLRKAMQWPVVHADLEQLGVSGEALDAMVRDLALARRTARPTVEALDRRQLPRATTSRSPSWRKLGLGFHPSEKAGDSNRFSLSLEDASRTAEGIAGQIGIVRIGLIGELDTLGVHVAQAFGERSGWSTSFASGKAETREGARVGSIMEEAEIHAQDAFQAHAAVHGSFAHLADVDPLLDPRTLDLPYDSRYDPSLELGWTRCVDILGCRELLIPSACLTGERLPHDIYYSPRLGGKIFSSSGLGSGFSLAEAAVHAAAEVIERHAVRLAEIELDNPGAVGVRQFWFVDLETLPEAPRRLVDKYRAAGMTVRILDITSEIAVPTFVARVFDDPFESDTSHSSDGSACHPDPAVAVTMALLEAAQTKAGVIAGGREDYSLQARSLGRHERPRTMVPTSHAFWFCNDRPVRAFSEIPGQITRDLVAEFEWVVDRVQDAGYEQMLLADYTMARIHPAHAVRVIIPGAESTNPLFTGTRARATVIRDLLPRSTADL